MQVEHQTQLQNHLVRSGALINERMGEIGIFPPRYYLIDSAPRMFRSSYHHEHLLKGIVATYTFPALIILTSGNQKSAGIGKHIAILMLLYDNIAAGTTFQLCCVQKAEKFGRDAPHPRRADFLTFPPRYGIL